MDPTSAEGEQAVYLTGLQDLKFSRFIVSLTVHKRQP